MIGSLTDGAPPTPPPRCAALGQAGTVSRTACHMETLLLVLAAVFPVVNPPGSALVFLSMTSQASAETRRTLARRVAINSFFVMTGSLLLGTFVLNLYGISVPVLRVAGGFVVAVSGWKLLNEGSHKEQEQPELLS